MKPNARPEPRLEAGATEEQTLEGVGSRPSVRQRETQDNHPFVYLQSLYSSIDFRGLLQLGS